jgi:hypothetical protein
MNTAELEGAVLNYWVAQVEQLLCKVHVNQFGVSVARTNRGVYNPAGIPSEGHPLMELYLIGVDTWQRDMFSDNIWAASFSHPVPHPDTKRSPSHHRMRGPRPLVAAMRTLVSSKYGDQVPEIPKEDLVIEELDIFRSR